MLQNYKDSITEAAKKVLHPNQKALDADKDGDIEADDLKDLRAKKVDEADPCWKGYKQVGMKDKDGKKVPNCVPEETEVTERVTGGYSKSYSNPYYAEQKAKMKKLDAARKAREKAAKEAKAKSCEPVKEDSIDEMSDVQMTRREKLIKGMKKSKADFEKRYGKDAESIMYATATKNAMKEETIEEASDTYFPTFSAAVQHAYDATEKKGYTVDSDDWQNKVSTGPKKPSVGKTNSYNINLMKNGKESKQKLHIQVYGMEGGKYELNFYVS